MVQRFRQWPESGTSGRVHRRMDTQREDVDFKGRTIIIRTSSVLTLQVQEKSFNGLFRRALSPLGADSNSTNKWQSANSHSAENFGSDGLCNRLSVLRLRSGLCLFISLHREFLCHGILQFLSTHSVAFGCVHENVIAA